MREVHLTGLEVQGDQGGEGVEEGVIDEEGLERSKQANSCVMVPEKQNN